MIIDLDETVTHLCNISAGGAPVVAARGGAIDLEGHELLVTVVENLRQRASEHRRAVAVDALQAPFPAFCSDPQMPSGRVIIEPRHLSSDDDGVSGCRDKRASVG